MEPVPRLVFTGRVGSRRMEPCDLLLDNAAQVVTLAGPAPKRRAALDAAGILEHAAVAVRDGRICAVGEASALRARFRPARTVDTRGGCIVPGFVDAHTHPVFAATRESEYDARLHGA